MSTTLAHNHEGFAEEIKAIPLPGGWARTSINEIGEVRLGRQRSPKNVSAKHPTKYIRAANLTWTGLNLSDVLEMEFRPSELETYRLHPGDILLSEASGSATEVGKPAIWKNEIEDCCFQNTVIRFRSTVVTPKFAHLAFSHFARNGVFSRASKGVGIHHLSADRFSVLPFLLPPAREQERIVEKVEELFSDLDAGVAVLQRILVKFKRYRAAVLKAAVEGKLTADWRAKHLNGEHAADLLKRILAVRRRKWEEDQLAKYAKAGKEPPEGWRERYQEPAGPDVSALPALPDRWCWVTMDQIAEIQGGIQKQPKRAPNENAYPFLRVANVYRGRLDLSEIHKIELFGGELEPLRLNTGDMLIVEGNGSITEIGRCAIWNGEIEECVHQNHIIRVRPLVGNPRFFEAYWNSPFGNRRIMALAASTSGLYTLSVAKVSSLPVPLSPVVEQIQIIAELDQRLSIVDTIAAQVEANLKRAGCLRQSILKRAFEGKLVPQIATDEPASVLLERIRHQRQQATDSAADANGRSPTTKRRAKPKARKSAKS